MPSHGRRCRLDAPCYISSAILRAKYNEGRLNDRLAHGQVRQAMAGLGVACRLEQAWMLALVAANNHTDCVTGDPSRRRWSHLDAAYHVLYGKTLMKYDRGV